MTQNFGLFVLAILLWLAAIVSVKKGVTIKGHNTFTGDRAGWCYRDQQPKTFWLIIATQVIMGFVMLFGVDG